MDFCQFVVLPHRTDLRRPQRFAVFAIQREHVLAVGPIAHGVNPVAHHRHAGVSRAEALSLPGELRTLLSPLFCEAGVGRNAVAFGTAPSGPVGSGGDN